jgi:hypothetical protein
MAHEVDDFIAGARFLEIGVGKPRTEATIQAERYYRRFQREVGLCPGSEAAREAYRVYREFRDRVAE